MQIVEQSTESVKRSLERWQHVPISDYYVQIASPKAAMNPSTNFVEIKTEFHFRRFSIQITGR